MLSFQFGIGSAFILPSGTVGNPPSPLSPQRILTIADAEITFKRKNEKLMGQNQNPDDIAASDEDVSFKLSAGRVGLDTYNLMFGETISTGGNQAVVDEGPTAIPATTFQVTVAKSTLWLSDLGVLNAATLQPMQQIPSGTPLAGQYTCAAGVYTFSSADHTSGISVLISYLYTPATGGRTLTRLNHIQGYSPVNSIVIVAPYTSAGAASPLGVVRLRAVRFTDMGLPMKRAGYLVTPISGEAFPDASGSIWDLWSPA